MTRQGVSFHPPPRGQISAAVDSLITPLRPSDSGLAPLVTGIALPFAGLRASAALRYSGRHSRAAAH
jgi:hypothetical protein